MQRVSGLLLLLCLCNSQLSFSQQAITTSNSDEKLVTVQAKDLFGSLKMLSEQTGEAVFFAADLANISADFYYFGDNDLTSIIRLIATHYQVNIEQLEDSLIVSQLTINAVENDKSINNAPSLPEKKDIPLEEVIISASSVQTKRARRYSVNNDVNPDDAVRVESISLMNAASFATNNLADSLLNVAGISASYDSAEARQVAMRGLSGDFIHVALNGMQTLAIHGSSLDSRGQNERAIAFDFNVLPSELFEKVDIVKEYSVVQDSGGIAGNINLYTSSAEQLMDEESQLNTMFEYSQTDFVDEPTYRGAFSWQYKRRHWFYMLGGSVNNKVTQEQGYNTYRWRHLDIASTDISQLSTDIQQKLQAQEVYFPRGNRYSIWNNTIKQQGVTAAVHYHGDNFSHKLDWLYAELNNQKQEYHLSTRGISSSALVAGSEQPSKITQLEIDEHDYLRFAEFENAQIATESRQINKTTQFSQLTWRGDYWLSAKLKLNWLLGSSKNELDVPKDEKVFLKGFSNLTTDYSPQLAHPHNSYGMDLQSSRQWQLDEIDIQANQSLIEQQQGNIGFSYQHGATLWQFGIQYKRFVDERVQKQQDDLYKREFNTGLLDSALDGELSKIVDYYKEVSWLGVNNSNVAKRYLTDIRLDSGDILDSQSYSLERINSAAWLQYEYQQDDYSVDLGIRIEHFDEQVYHAKNFESKNSCYSRPLFSANFRHALSANWQARLNVSENLTPVATKYFNPTKQPLSGITGYEVSNTALSAYESQQFTLQLIGNVDSHTQLVSSVYAKKLSGLINYQQLADDKNLYQRVNQATAWVKGIDIDLTHHLQPHITLNAAYSYADSERDYRFADMFKYTGQLEGLSKHVANFSVDYQQPTWGSRLQLNYRSGYISEINYQQIWVDQFETGFLPFKRINWSAYFALNDVLELNVGVNNLSNEYYREYAGQHHAIYNTTQAGRQYYLRFILML
ncbi:TonB-dependent receptor plug domain-containing protein [Pseudoalteromonas rhizosphaerae]|uniref:TonB-dependent receptor plug domain-containing protein n=1 Tax=Pseudoalteromonas rhizosphaerae TaxID=2518973 RepID=A0ABW8KSM8_9GAMM